MSEIKVITFGTSRSPLRNPYKLSFTTVTEFESVWVRIENDAGEVGIGEAVALPGYSWETTASILACLDEIVSSGDGHTEASLRATCAAKREKNPFATSAVVTALDLLVYLKAERPVRGFPLNLPISSEMSFDELDRCLKEGLTQGYRFAKVKIGKSLENDVAAVPHLMARWSSNYLFVFDANQAYDLDQANQFCVVLQPYIHGPALWLEQPLNMHDWEGHAALCAQTNTPIVLDESIYNQSDVVRAKSIGASGVKLKLFKNHGISGTLALARQARALGLGVVFGNGVATDIGNFAEYIALINEPNLFDDPLECNGFIKQKQPQLFPNLALNKHGEIDYNGTLSEAGNILKTHRKQGEFA